MTIQRGDVPEWTLGDRLRKARSLTGLNTQEFADRIGCSRGAVTTAENDKHRPRRIVVNAWALATGVSVEWLTTGEPEMHGPASPGKAKPAEVLPRLDSNQQPSGYTLSLVTDRILCGEPRPPAPVEDLMAWRERRAS